MYNIISNETACTYRVRRQCMSHPPGPIFHARYLHSCNSVGAEKVGVVNISWRAFRRRVVRYWHPLRCRAVELGKPPQECVIYTVLHGYLLPVYIWYPVCIYICVCVLVVLVCGRRVDAPKHVVNECLVWFAKQSATSSPASDYHHPTSTILTTTLSVLCFAAAVAETNNPVWSRSTQGHY